EEELVRLGALRERDPDEEPALGAAPPTPRGEAALERAQHVVAPRPVLEPHALEVRREPALLEERDEGGLQERARAAVLDLLERFEGGEDGGGCRAPADAQAGEELLREGADVEHVPAAVERMQRRHVLPLEPQVPCPVVLHDDAPVASDEGEDLAAPRFV